MQKNNFRTKFIIATFFTSFGFLAGCSSFQPSHTGRYSFEGTVKDESGKPLKDVWVKILGWETATNSSGKWEQVHVVKCGALREHMESHDEQDSILLYKDGFDSKEEKFNVNHPSWFQSCEKDSRMEYDTVLKRSTASVTKAEPSDEPKKPPKEAPKGVSL